MNRCVRCRCETKQEDFAVNARNGKMALFCKPCQKGLQEYRLAKKKKEQDALLAVYNPTDQIPWPATLTI